MMNEAPQGFIYVPDFLSLTEQDSLLSELRALTYVPEVFRGVQNLTQDQINQTCVDGPRSWDRPLCLNEPPDQ